MVNDGRTLVDSSVVDRSSPAVVHEECLLLTGRYRLLQPLGVGGMGTVYLAEDRLLARQVAIKTIRPELSTNEEVRSRIKRECRLHAAIGSHPHIVTLFDTFEENGHFYLVMEYFSGKTLAALLAASKGGAVLGVEGSLALVHQLLLALETIHGAGIVHRDIKTANIILQEKEGGGYLAKLTDFGIARTALEDGSVTRLTALDVQGPGTPTYMAPERIDPQSFGPIGPAADLYSVGVILYELLSGQPPFTGTMTEIFSGHLVHAPDLDALPATVPSEIRKIVQTALAKHAEERFTGARPFVQAVEDLLLNLSKEHAAATALDIPASPLSEEHTLLVTSDVEADADATRLHPRMAQKRPLRQDVPRRRLFWFGGGVAFVVLLSAVLLFIGGLKLEPKATHQTAAAAPAISSQVKNPTQEPPSSQPTVSALDTLETVRQQKSSAATMAADRASIPTDSEWRVVENSSRKIR